MHGLWPPSPQARKLVAFLKKNNTYVLKEQLLLKNYLTKYIKNQIYSYQTYEISISWLFLLFDRLWARNSLAWEQEKMRFVSCILKGTAKENTLAVFSLPFLVNIGQSTDDGKMEEHIPANLVYHLLNKKYYFTLWYVLKGLNYPLLIFKILLIPYEEIIPFCIRMEYLARSNLKKKALSFITSC